DFKFLASFGDPINDLRKLPHDMRFFGIAEVQAIRRAYGSSPSARNVARSFGNRVHRAEFGIEIAPTPVAIECHREPALRTPVFRIFDSNHTTVADTRTFYRVCLDHRIVLLIDPALGADICTRKQLLEIAGQVKLL